MKQKAAKMNTKTRYRLYKSGKLWLIAGLTSVALFDFVMLAPTAQAATPDATTSQVTATTETTADSAATGASADTAASTLTSETTKTAAAAVTSSAPTTTSTDTTAAQQTTTNADTTATKQDTSSAATTVSQQMTTTATDTTASKQAATTATPAKTATTQATTAKVTTDKNSVTLPASQTKTAVAATTTTDQQTTTALTGRTETTAQVTTQILADGQLFDQNTTAIPVGTELTPDAQYLVTDNAGQLHLLQYVGYALNGGNQVESDKIVIPDADTVALALNYTVDPALSLPVAYMIDNGKQVTGSEIIGSYTADSVPEYHASQNFDSTGKETITLYFSALAQSGQLSGSATPAKVTFELDSQAKTATLTTDTTETIDYDEAVQTLAANGIQLDGTVYIPNYLDFAQYERIEFTSYPAAVAGTHQVAVSYTYADGAAIDPTEPAAILTATDSQLTADDQITTGGYATTLNSNIAGDSRNNALLGGTLKQIILTTADRTYTYALSDYDNGTFNKIYVTMKANNDDGTSQATSQLQAGTDDKNWYDENATELGFGIPYLNDSTNKAADKLLATLLAQGIGIDGTVNFSTYADFAKFDQIQFVYAGQGFANPGQIAQVTYTAQTTTGQRISTSVYPTNVSLKGDLLSASVSVPVIEDGQPHYLFSAYAQTLTDVNGNPIQVSLPFIGIFKDLTETAATQNLVELPADYQWDGGYITDTGSVTTIPGYTNQNFAIIDPTQPTNLVQTIEEVPSQITAHYENTQGIALTADHILQSTLVSGPQATADALTAAQLTLNAHGALQQIVLETSDALQALQPAGIGAQLGLPSTKYVRYTFNSDQTVLVETYDDPATIISSTQLSTADATAELTAAGIGTDGSVNMPNLIRFDITKAVTFTYQPASTLVDETQTQTHLTVHYVDQAGNVLSPSITKTAPQGTAFSITAPATIGNHILISPDQTVKGTYQGNAMTITYTYQAVPQVEENQGETQLTVHYVDDQGNTLAPSVVKTAPKGTAFSITAPATIGNHILISPDQTVKGTYQGNAMTITYTYQAVPQVDESQGETQLTVHYVDDQGNELAPSVVKTAPKGTAFSVTAPATIGSYSLVSPDQTVTGTYQGNAMTITYTYQAIPQVDENQGETQLTVHYVNNQGNTLAPSVVKTAPKGTAFSVTAPATIGSYSLISPDQTVTGTYQGNAMTITYTYQAIPEVDESQGETQLTVHYVDDQGNELAPSVIKTAPKGTAFSVTAPATIGNYSLVSPDQTVTGTYQGNAMAITYTYQAIPQVDESQTQTQLTVHYVDQNGKTIAADTTQSGQVGTDFTVTAPTISGYTTQQRVVTGTYQGNAMTLTLHYQKDGVTPDESQTQTQLTVHYVDENGHPIAADTTQNGLVGTAFTITAPTINGYTLQNPAQATLTGQYQGNAMTLTLVYQAVTPQEPNVTPQQPAQPTQPNATPQQPTATPVVGQVTAKPTAAVAVKVPTTSTPVTTHTTIAQQRQTISNGKTQTALPQTGSATTTASTLGGIGLVAVASLFGLGAQRRRKQ
ncbi:MucBP domain-containing protein [Loigolactobacillus bifermentans]|uniref:Gy family cell surface protein n=1 Tax=Loigolactobacillus bifermentans DSM 20003 TaxID=1423726 RepID=A0A0R1GGG3_9LACO|nr:MucBP domain-containing protein [Loigolactobacillus bifermentans]KRK33141.1 gy family cell surface protein [Loigolactobacillus bifermentans DSM 20003]QGG60494.1 LPXTG cell wall anchor domain-containing protein [Loigolactobacillus bifermentans]